MVAKWHDLYFSERGRQVDKREEEAMVEAWGWSRQMQVARAQVPKASERKHMALLHLKPHPMTIPVNPWQLSWLSDQYSP